MAEPEEKEEVEAGEYTVKIKAICTQTVKVKAKDDDDAAEKAADGGGEIVTDFEWHEAYEQDDWEVTKT